MGAAHRAPPAWKGYSTGLYAPRVPFSRKARRRWLRLGWRSLRRALASIWRMRSRVTAKFCPTSSSVCSLPSSRPKRILMIFSSRGVSVFSTCAVCSRKLRLITASEGEIPFWSTMKSPRCDSSSSPIGEEEESHLGDFIVDQNGISPSDAVINLNLREQTAQVLKTLTPREEKIIKMRFGLEDGSEHTLEEVGQNFAVTRERIRQIEAKALRKLRHPSRSHRLRAFLENGTRGA